MSSVYGLSPAEALEKAGLNWKVVPLPVLVQGNSATIPAPGWKALMRSDLGTDQVPLDITSDKYEPFQNASLVNLFYEVANTAGVSVGEVGSYDGGRKIFATSYAVNKWKGEVSVGDAIRAGLRMTSGHGGGRAFRVTSFIERLVCSNGATREHIVGAVVVPHRTKLDQGIRERLADLAQRAGLDFQRFLGNAQKLWGTATSVAETRIFVADLLGRSLLDEALEETGIRQREGLTRGAFLREVAYQTGGNIKWPADVSTRHRNILEEVVAATERNQVGLELSRGTLWNTYNGITYHFNHRSNRTADSRIDSLYHGENRKVIQRAEQILLEAAA